MQRIVRVLIGIALGPLLCSAQEAYQLDPATSVIQIHLDTAGALGFVGHAHLIQTPIEQGKFLYYPGDPAKSSVELQVAAGALEVMDPKVSARHKSEIQATMQSDRVLDIKRYPKIAFKSLTVALLETNRLQITGKLTIRSQTQPVAVETTLLQVGPQLKATGKCRFKQSTFGIHPVTAGLGTVRVRDQMDISFVVFMQPKPPLRSSASKDRLTARP